MTNLTPDEQAVAANVRAKCAYHQIDQATIAEAIGRSRASVSQRLNGHRPFSVAELIVIANLAGVEPAEFFRPANAPSRVA